MTYRARCPWCNRWTPPQDTKKQAISMIMVHQSKAKHPPRDKVVVREAVKRSVEPVG